MMNRISFPRICYSPDGPTGGGSAAPSGGAPSTSGGGSSSSSTPSGGAPSGGSTPSPSPGSPSPPSSPSQGSPADPGTPSEAPGTAGDGFFDLSGLEAFDGGDEDDEPVGQSRPPTQAQPTPGQQPSQPQQQPQPQPQQAQQPVAPGTQQPQQPTTQQQGQPGPQGATPRIPSPAEPGAIADELMKNFSEISNHLASTPDFQLSKEDLEGLESNPADTISKVAARTFVRAQAAAMRQMANAVPAMVKQQISVMRKQMERENAFYSAWPQLKRDQHSDLVDRYARSYRQTNPTATFDQMMKDVGAMVMIAAGIQPGQQPVVNGRQQPPSPMRPGGRSPQPAPFVPAMPGAGGGSPQPQPASMWDGFQGGGEEDE